MTLRTQSSGLNFLVDFVVEVEMLNDQVFNGHFLHTYFWQEMCTFPYLCSIVLITWHFCVRDYFEIFLKLDFTNHEKSST